MENFGDAFTLSVITMMMAGLAMCVKSCISSKCSNTEFCFGCLKIVRDVHVEEEIELAVINRSAQPPIIGDNIV